MNDAHRRHWSRRRILAVIGLVVVGVGVLGAATGIPRIERDLGRRVQRELVKAGYDGITAKFSGQDGTLRCSVPLGDGPGAVNVAEDVWGVRVARLDSSCTTGAEPQSPAADTTATPGGLAPVASSGDTSPAAATSPLAQAAAGTALASFADGAVALSGTVASEAQHQTLLISAQQAVAAANITDQIVVDAAVALTDDQVSNVGKLVAAMPPNLVSGEAGWDGTALFARGVYADDAGKTAFEQAAAAAGVAPELAPRAQATTDQAAALEQELNTLVAAEPILFDAGQATIKAESQATVEKVAGIAKRYGGVKIRVQGHTDSDGDEAGNQVLSEARARAVLDALVSLGVPAADLSSEGFGETQPVLENGVENKDKSRRVVFAVAAG